MMVPVVQDKGRALVRRAKESFVPVAYRAVIDYMLDGRQFDLQPTPYSTYHDWISV